MALNRGRDNATDNGKNFQSNGRPNLLRAHQGKRAIQLCMFFLFEETGKSTAKSFKEKSRVLQKSKKILQKTENTQTQQK